ncbi:seryl-tRNA synthetase [Neoconidiobolus thromboides FSU 785]|nr:seryl-tRNA synthetase [Neoconidiobolus thromboides FSU 785]
MIKNIAQRNLSNDIDLDEALNAYNEYGKLQYLVNNLRQKRTQISTSISKVSTTENRQCLVLEAKEIKKDISEKEEELETLEQKALKLGCLIPNFTHPESPIGSEENAKTILTKNRRAYPSTITDGTEFLIKKDMLDLRSAAKVSGNSFYYLKNQGAMLELALCQLALSKAMSKGFSPILTPDLVRKDIVNACGFQPRDNNLNQNYNVSAHSNSDLYLAATSEIALAGMNLNQIIQPGDLPMKWAGQSHCFRAEAGARGKETKGLYRVHQFTKVELFAFCSPMESEKTLKEILEFQIEFFNDLELDFRVLDMPTEELGASAYRKFDIEAYLPHQNRWGEISSASNCTDYQSRRLNIRLTKDPKTQISEFVHTVNGTACAVPRTILAIVEQNQNGKGEVVIPKILRPYFNNSKYF